MTASDDRTIDLSQAFPVAHQALARALAERGYAQPTPVQTAVLRPEAAGRDLLVSAQTGSGKTAAYGLAMAPELLDRAERLGPATEPLALVVAPTRELALQVQGELAWLYGPAGARLASCVGGMDIRRERRALAQGAHIVVGTPGRLRDHLERGSLGLSQARVVVLDEADEMLDLGFREDLELILDATPGERRTLLFSATIPKEIVALAKQYQRDALRIATTREREPHGDIEYRAVLFAPSDREHAIVNVLRFFEARGALVFCSTREAVRQLQGNLLERGFAVVALSGELSQSERTRALQALREGQARVCVATDVAARGIDLPDLGLVVHADLPNGRETLLHRSGRTGRAGRKGASVLLVPYTRRRHAERLLASASLTAAWSGPPTADEVRARDRERLVRDVLAAAAADGPTDDDRAAARALLAGQNAEEVAATLVRLHRTRLPAPEELLDDGSRVGPERAEPRAAGSPGEAVWFRMAIGRRDNADPRWLLPLICRRGHVTKREIGAIRILDRETRFAVAGSAAGRFAAAVRSMAGGRDGEVRIEPVDEADTDRSPGPLRGMAASRPPRRPEQPRPGPGARRGSRSGSVRQSS